jgi:hypothetical protein
MVVDGVEIGCVLLWWSGCGNRRRVTTVVGVWKTPVSGYGDGRGVETGGQWIWQSACGNRW